MSLLPILILTPYRCKVQAATQRTQANEANADAIAHVVERLRGRSRERVCRDDTSNIAETNLPGGAYCPSVMATQVHGEPAYDDGHSRVCAGSYHEESAILEVMVMMLCDQDRKAGDRNADWNHCEEEAMPESIREKSNKHAEAKRSSPRRDRVQLGLDIAISIGLNDAWSEVCVAVGWDDKTKVHQTTQEDLVIFETVEHVLGSDRPFQGGSALVIRQSLLYEGALLFREPFYVLLLLVSTLLVLTE